MFRGSGGRMGTHPSPTLRERRKWERIKMWDNNKGHGNRYDRKGVCAGSTFTFAAIYYEWTSHNNQSNLNDPLNKADTFDSTWTAPGGSTALYTFNITVPVVRPDHETTVCARGVTRFRVEISSAQWLGEATRSRAPALAVNNFFAVANL